MRIAYISYPAFADCDFPLIRALREQGNEVMYFLILSPFHCHSTLVDISCLKATYDIIPGDSYPELEQYNSYLNASSINIVNFGGNSKWGRLRLWYKFHHALRMARPDAIQLTHFFPPYAIFYYLTFRNKLFITIHDPVHHTGEYSRRDVLLRKIGTSAMRGFVFLSRNDTLINAFKERYHIPQRKIHYAALAPYDVLSAIPRDQTKHPSDFLFIGRISQYKGIDTLLEAMTLLSDTRPKAKLIVAGAGDFWFDISNYKNNPCIEIIHRFITPGELVAFIQDTRYVICPYTDGTQSGVIMSALAFGRPVIASNVGNFSSIIKNGVNGILVPPSNPTALAEAMESALDPSKDSIIQESMSGTDFSQEWDMIARMYIDAYRSSYHDHPKANSLPAK